MVKVTVSADDVPPEEYRVAVFEVSIPRFRLKFAVIVPAAPMVAEVGLVIVIPAVALHDEK